MRHVLTKVQTPKNLSVLREAEYGKCRECVGGNAARKARNEKF